MHKQAHAVFPLLCDLCPKKPRFSDVSHLLTHISSKSHLSNRFKLQIRSQGEPEARRLLADFDNWYISNDLGDLLSERLNAKEKRKGTKRAKVTTAPARSDVKAEIKADSPMDQPLAATPIYRPPIPRMHSWSTDPYVTEFTAPSLGSPWILNSAYETPSMKRSIPNFVRIESPAPSSTQFASPTPLKGDDTEEEAEKESSKLKGVFWPGMDLFDSATAEMKRMRNQKKDGSALQQMKISSARIEPAEWVFNPDGGFRKIRDIFDESTESSPAGSFLPPTPKKRRTRKKALADASTNAPRLKNFELRQQPRRRVSTKRKLVKENIEGVPKKKAQLSHLSLSTDIRYSPSAEEYEEFRRTMGDLAWNRPLKIFHDIQDSPARTESPLEDHRFEFSPAGTTVLSKSGNTIQNSPTPMFKPVPMRFGGKENVAPGQLSRHHMPTAAIGFNSETFNSNSLNPLYNHSHAHARAFSNGHGQMLEAVIKPSYTSFRGGDFKPQMMADPFGSMHEPHGLLNISGSGLPDNIRYGM